MVRERRQHARSAPHEGYFLSCLNPECVDRPYSLSTRLLDVGPGGACLATFGPLPERLRLLLDIRLPGALARFRARAVVAWSRLVRSTQHAAGLRFENVEEERTPEVVDAPRPAEPRRRHKRYFPGRAAVEFTPRTRWTSIGFRAANRALRIVDLNAGGVQLVCDAPVAPGAVGGISLDFSRPRVTVEGEARVVWCRRNTLLLAPEWNVGLAFRRIADPESLRVLDRDFLG